jgi:arginine decarboxylase-like protein
LPKLPNLTSAASPRVDISSTCKVGQKRGVSLPLLTCFPAALPSRLLDRRGRKSRRDL